MQKRKLLIIAIAIGIIALGVILFRVQTATNDSAPKEELVLEGGKFVNTIKAEYGDYNADIVANGRLSSINKIELFAEVGGIMQATSKAFKVGNSFSKGDIIIAIDAEEARLALYAAKSSFLNLLTSSLADIKADFPDAFDKWKSYLDNFSIEKDIPNLPETKNEKIKYFLSNRQIFTQYYNIKNSEVRLSKYNLRAPFSGTVTASMVEPGTYIRPGQKLGDFASTGTYELELSVSIDDIPFVNIGDVAKVTGQNMKGEWTGRIVRIAKNIDPNSQTVKVYLNVTGNDLKDGLYMKAVIEGKTISDVVKIPRKAIVNNEFVYIVKDSSMNKSPVDIVKFTEYDAYIQGVEPNELIITDAIVDAEVGMKVRTINQ